MILIWGTNFSLVKVALRDFPEIPFNAMRMAVATAVFLAAIRWTRDDARPRPSLTRADWIRLVFLGLVGTFLYQLCSSPACSRTSVGNGSLIVGISPIVIALMSAMAGHERIGRCRWVGVLWRFARPVFRRRPGRRIVGRKRSRGDLLMLGGMFCWASYSVASQPILKRHSPLTVTGTTFSIGAGALPADDGADPDRT